MPMRQRILHVLVPEDPRLAFLVELVRVGLVGHLEDEEPWCLRRVPQEDVDAEAQESAVSERQWHMRPLDRGEYSLRLVAFEPVNPDAGRVRHHRDSEDEAEELSVGLERFLSPRLVVGGEFARPS
jgi:hypothetical protein